MDLEELSTRLMFGAVRVLRHTVPGQGVHGQLIQGPTGRCCPLQADHWRVLPRCLRRVRASVRCPSAIAEARYPRVRWRRRERSDELAPRPPPNFLVFLNVDVNGKDGHSFGHDEREGAKVERPAIGVSVFLVIVAFVTRVSCVAGDVDDDANYVAQTWNRKTTESRNTAETGKGDGGNNDQSSMTFWGTMMKPMNSYWVKLFISEWLQDSHHYRGP